MNINPPLRSKIPPNSTFTSTSISAAATRIILPSPARCLRKPQVRHATLIKRPLRPYTFTQLVTLSDGSTFTHRTTSPTPVYVSTKDSRNTPLWNPSSQKLLNVEADEAGKLRRFREKFGRGWDATGLSAGKKQKEIGEGVDRGGKGRGSAAAQVTRGERIEEGEDNLMDLISDYGRDVETNVEEREGRKPEDVNEKEKGGGK